MTYVVTEACIRCKYMDCVEVCPVDCFYEGTNMLVTSSSFTLAETDCFASRRPLGGGWLAGMADNHKQAFTGAPACFGR